jgi:hypothetical protein
MPKEFALILWDLRGNHHHHHPLLVAKKHWEPYFKIFQSTCFQSSLPFLIVLNILLMLQLMLQSLFRTTVSKHVSIQCCSIYTCMYIYDTSLYSIYTIYIYIYLFIFASFKIQSYLSHSLDRLFSTPLASQAPGRPRRPRRSQGWFISF